MPKLNGIPKQIDWHKNDDNKTIQQNPLSFFIILLFGFVSSQPAAEILKQVSITKMLRKTCTYLSTTAGLSNSMCTTFDGSFSLIAMSTLVTTFSLIPYHILELQPPHSGHHCNVLSC